MRKFLGVWLLLVSGLGGATLPEPQKHFGHPIGEDRTVLEWDQVVSYFRELAAATPQVLVKEVGQTLEGRAFIYATISSADNIRKLDQYQEIQRRLADPRGLNDGDAERLIQQGKTVVLITCSIHSTELASTHSAVEFVYRLLSEDTPKHRAILNNTIFLLIPSLNPDGVDIVTQWYRKTLGTPYEGTSPPELYQKYVGHDNNRDWYIFSQPETRHTITYVQNVWHPQIVYDVHQQGAYASRMFVPPWLDPVDPNVDPIIAQQANSIGAGMASDLTSAGKTGVAINALYDFWTPSRHYQSYHGGVRILSESASAKLASPITVKPSEIDERGLGYDPRQRSWNYLEPWLGGEWHLRDIIDYQLIAMESCLYQAAIRREDMLRSFYRVGKRQSARVQPYAFIVPASQRDPGATKKLLETLQFGQVEIEQAQSPFTADGRSYGAGSYLIRMQQPYSGFAKTLLERQSYPDLRMYPGGPPRRPYDVTAQTLPLLMGVNVITAKERFSVFSTKTSQFVVQLNDSPATSSALPASDTQSWHEVNRAWKAGGTVFRDPTTGDFFIGQGGGNLQLLKRPRIGVYKSYLPVIDEGWTRWLLDQFGFIYTSLSNGDVVRGGLRSKFDVIVFPDELASAIHTGYKPGSMPEQYTGGLGDAGAKALREFTTAGGKLVFLNESCRYASEHLGIEAKSVTDGLPNTELYVPGSLLNVSVADAASPLVYGLPQEFTAWAEASPAWEIATGTPYTAVLKYPEKGVLASGWLLGEKVLSNRSPLIVVPVGQGHVILFGMRPQYRAQSYLTFKLFFNSLVY